MGGFFVAVFHALSDCPSTECGKDDEAQDGHYGIGKEETIGSSRSSVQGEGNTCGGDFVVPSHETSGKKAR